MRLEGTNPIELMWSKLETLLRPATARTSEALNKAIRTPLRKITAMDAAARMPLDGYLRSVHEIRPPLCPALRAFTA